MCSFTLGLSVCSATFYPSFIYRLFTYLYGNKDGRQTVLKFWNDLKQCGYSASDTYINMLTTFTHNNDVPEISIATEDDDVTEIKEITLVSLYTYCCLVWSVFRFLYFTVISSGDCNITFYVSIMCLYLTL